MAKVYGNIHSKSSKIIVAFMAIVIIASSALIYQIIMGGSRTNSSISIFGFSQETIPLYGTIEVNINVTAAIDNPFDPSEANVSVVFTAPSSQTIEVPAFYYQEYDRSLTENREILTPAGEPFWKTRFTPTEVGEYSFYAKLKKGTQTETTDVFTFDVASSSSRGFVRVSSVDRRFFRFDDGSSFFFVGHDVCWSGSRGTFDYDEWFSSMNQSGETITRIWMAPWVFGIEWTELGNYNLAEAWRLDYVLKKAQEKGIYVLLCFMNHGQLQAAESTAQWKDNPYNKANGGPLEKPEDFWTSEEAIELFKKRLKYIVSRWGYSTNILAWELWNEVELTDNYDFVKVSEWHNDMAEFVRNNDPYGHLITTSSDSRFGSLQSLDLLTVHRYGPTGFLDIGGAVHDLIGDLVQQYQKPVILAEFGADWRWSNDSYTTKDAEGVQIHNGIWSSVHSGSASSAMLWWWDNYIHPNNLYYHFEALSRYLEGIKPDEAGLKDLEVQFVQPAQINVEDLCNLTIYPSLGWSRPEADVFEVDMYGNVGNASQLSGYIHGAFHPDLRNNPTFIVNFTYGGEVVVHVNSVANSGAVLKIFVDGSLAKTVNLTDIDGKNDGFVNEYNLDVSVPVPAGRHEVKLDNGGNDWFTVDYMIFTKAVLKSSKARVMGLCNDTFAMVWVQNKEHTWWNVINQMPVEPLESVELELLGFQDGTYTVEWWDTYTGEIVRTEFIQAVGGKIPLHVETLDKDVAIKLTILTIASKTTMG
jgi:hypothetical protein